MNSFAQRAAVAASALLLSVAAQAATFVVDAQANSTSGGVGLSTISLFAGQSFSVSASQHDLWSAGYPDRLSDADGLSYTRIASPLDDMGPQDGVSQIGINFGNYSQGGLSAPYGTLVGSLDGGSTFFKIGTSYTGVAATAGTLNLYYFDSNANDNSGSITATVTAVPEPGSVSLGLAGVLMAGLLLRSRGRD